MKDLIQKASDELVEAITNLKICDYCYCISETKTTTIEGTKSKICENCNRIRGLIKSDAF